MILKNIQDIVNTCCIIYVRKHKFYWLARYCSNWIYALLILFQIYILYQNCKKNSDCSNDISVNGQLNSMLIGMWQAFNQQLTVMWLLQTLPRILNRSFKLNWMQKKNGINVCTRCGSAALSILLLFFWNWQFMIYWRIKLETQHSPSCQYEKG